MWLRLLRSRLVKKINIQQRIHAANNTTEEEDVRVHRGAVETEQASIQTSDMYLFILMDPLRGTQSDLLLLHRPHTESSCRSRDRTHDLSHNV